MSMNNRWMVELGGWYGSLILLFAYLASEVGYGRLGGDWGGFLYVTFHFIIMPLGSICIIILTFIRICRKGTLINRLLTIFSIVIPLTIILIAVTGSLITVHVFNIDFNK
jgi:phosphoglycerol transferase MdoB-like AlkP superfamily enzyme